MTQWIDDLVDGLDDTAKVANLRRAADLRNAAIRALVEQWREEATRETDEWNHEYALALLRCADQLAALERTPRESQLQPAQSHVSAIGAGKPADSHQPVRLHRAICDGCGLDLEFRIPAHLGDEEATLEARRLHANANESQERKCPTYGYLRVSRYATDDEVRAAGKRMMQKHALVLKRFADVSLARHEADRRKFDPLDWPYSSGKDKSK